MSHLEQYLAMVRTSEHPDSVQIGPDADSGGTRVVVNTGTNGPPGWTVAFIFDKAGAYITQEAVRSGYNKCTYCAQPLPEWDGSYSHPGACREAEEAENLHINNQIRKDRH